MDHAIMQAGGIDVPIYPTMTEADYKYILNHSESKFVFVSSAELFAKVNAVKDECPTLKGIFTFEDVSGADSWRKVLDAGSDENQAELDSRSESRQARAARNNYLHVGNHRTS